MPMEWRLLLLLAAHLFLSFYLVHPADVCTMGTCQCATAAGVLTVDCANRNFKEIPLLPRNVTKLDLNSNNILYLNGTGLTNLPKLRVLHLEFNWMRVIEFAALQGTTNLQELYLGHNHLEEIPAGLGLVAPSLEVLDVSACNYYMQCHSLSFIV